MKIQELLGIAKVKLQQAQAQNPAADPNHFAQIADLIHEPSKGYQNQPNEKYATVDAVTAQAGGGVNGPKHPADIRVKDPHLIMQPWTNSILDKNVLHTEFVELLNQTQQQRITEMAANGISTLALKRTRQDQKLALAGTDRADRNVVQPGRYLDTTADATQLPTRYNAASNAGALVDNPNVGGLLPGRPWA